jgi:hypothetical protein
MERLAYFIDDYSPGMFQVQIAKLKSDAKIIKQQKQRTTKGTDDKDLPMDQLLHYDKIRSIQIYRWFRRQQRQQLPQSNTVDSQQNHQHWNIQQCRTDDDMSNFYDALRHGIPHLESISLRNYTKNDLLVCAETYFSTQTEDKEDDDGAPADAISNVQSVFAHLARGESVHSRFLETLARLPKLNNVSIWVDSLDDDPFSTLLQSPTLKSLNVQRDQIMMAGGTLTESVVSTISQATSLFKALEINTTLRILGIEHDLCPQGILLLADMLRTNITLKSLTFSFDAQGDDNDVLTKLCMSLKSNNTLLHLQNRKSSSVTASTELQNSIISLLEHDNYVLRVLDLCKETGDGDDDDDSIKRFASQKTFYLKLNFWNRQQLLKSTDRKELIHSLHLMRDDLDCIYYFILKCPSIVSDIQATLPKLQQQRHSSASTTKKPRVSSVHDDTICRRPMKRKRVD